MHVGFRSLGLRLGAFEISSFRFWGPGDGLHTAYGRSWFASKVLGADLMLL